jgi:hypothetical protein
MSWIGREVVDRQTSQPISKRLAKDYPQIFGPRLTLLEHLPRHEILQKIAAAPFLCVPSTWDVFNLTAVEAMSLGTPVICSSQAGASMLIRHGENGFLFDSTQPAELADCIRRVLSLTETERAMLIEKARTTVRQMLDPIRLNTERIEYYQTLASSPRRAWSDEWLHTALLPRQEKDRLKILDIFTASELLAGVARKISGGIKRRIS